MIHPSYYELMDRINEENTNDDAGPLVTNRYSIVLAASKRARQLVNDYPTKYKMGKNEKSLSVAVKELYEGDVKILSTERQIEASEGKAVKSDNE